MKNNLIWLHEDSLRLSHPIFKVAPSNCEAIFIWDDEYLQQKNYSLKRLVFLYETLCELGINIFHGNTFQILESQNAKIIYVPSSPNPWIKSICEKLSVNKNMIFVDDEPFVCENSDRDFKRFFPYWKKIEKSAFMVNGGINLEDN
ncbi:MAG: hypothetical protein ACJA0S_000692 [Rickettsiales bacterium]|jgi:hypothetical protein